MSDRQEREDTESGVSLVAAIPDDVPTLVKIQAAAFKPDQFSNLMILGRDEGVLEGLLKKSVDLWMLDPKAELFKAVDTFGAIIGWSCWILKGEDTDQKHAYGSSSELKANTDQKSSSEERQNNSRKGDEPKKQLMISEGKEPSQQDVKKPTLAQVLGGLMFKDLVRNETEHMKGGKYLVLQALFTDPKCQGRGVGSKLVQQGVERADAGKLPCWIHASPAGYGVYTLAGFQEVGKFDMDLDEYAPGRRGVNRGWGRYTFRYMVRQPKSS
ncbi:hypothetical protein B0O99DRAFT_613068 [Bisporella sp. PMI_857]|nr:hypothetical protein B0O99DRAFT_613068 [Bisporella sp. PMI_857]